MSSAVPHSKRRLTVLLQAGIAALTTACTTPSSLPTDAVSSVPFVGNACADGIKLERAGNAGPLRLLFADSRPIVSTATPAAQANSARCAFTVRLAKAADANQQARIVFKGVVEATTDSFLRYQLEVDREYRRTVHAWGRATGIGRDTTWEAELLVKLPPCDDQLSFVVRAEAQASRPGERATLRLREIEISSLPNAQEPTGP